MSFDVRAVDFVRADLPSIHKSQKHPQCDMGSFDYTVVDSMIKDLVDSFSPKMIVIFGSVASHTAREDSDIDMMVVMETEEKKLFRSIPLREVLFKYHIPKDIFVYTPKEYMSGKDDEYSFINEIMTTGTVAYEA